MEDSREITTLQAATILISTIIGVGILPLPLFAVRAGDTGAPLVTLLGIGIAAIGLFIITKLGMRHPQKTIIAYSEEILGKWWGKICSLIVIIFFAFLTGFASREFGAVVITAILGETPLEIVVIVMLLLAAVSVRNNINTFAYIHNFYVPIILAPALIIVVFSLQNGNMIYLQPLTGNNFNEMFSGTLMIASLFQGSFIMTLIIPAMKHPKKAMKASMWAILISGGLYLLIVVATVSVFGTEEIKQLFWPTLELARTTFLPGNILQRLDVVFLSVWVTAVFTTLFSSYYFTAFSIKQFFQLQDHKMLAYFILPFVFILAMLPLNIFQLYQFIENVGKVGLTITILYPLLLLIIDFMKGKRRRGKSGYKQP
ncbi:amino acid permease [Peribacillus cavernae]|uniref:Amino acid permease n=1 Tax=Peribacillus cavernae TaxID=1674310 RepID=A0A433H8Z3_9BACI|nr:endospore germination permease [Peribacillus cavernae]MDQ0220773.1 spore germination protein [Peribacillus cavernae]RUQ24799.1 amino acid permease [Peribacillus cavernae]